MTVTLCTTCAVEAGDWLSLGYDSDISDDCSELLRDLFAQKFLIGFLKLMMQMLGMIPVFSGTSNFAIHGSQLAVF